MTEPRYSGQRTRFSLRLRTVLRQIRAELHRPLMLERVAEDIGWQPEHLGRLSGALSVHSPYPARTLCCRAAVSPPAEGEHR